MYTYEELKLDRDLWKNEEDISSKCSWCSSGFEIKNGTLYNAIRRDAEGIYCSRKCAGSARSYLTQQRYKNEGGKECKRCGEFKSLNEFSKIPTPPYYRSECKRCHGFKPARKYSYYKEKAHKNSIVFKLSLDQFLSFIGEPCYFCGDSISQIRLDLKDTYKGYTKSNTISCCKECSNLKLDRNEEEFIKICKKICINRSKDDEK